MFTVEDWIRWSKDSRSASLMKWHNEHLDLFDKSRGSELKHQAWEGGYRDHLQQCLNIADRLYFSIDGLGFEFLWDSVVLVLYFHDIEKMWKYTVGLPQNFDKCKFYTEELPKHGIEFTSEELNALKYIHGEGDDYCSERVMNELAALCHACDVISARCFHDRKNVYD